MCSSSSEGQYSGADSVGLAPTLLSLSKFRSLGLLVSLGREGVAEGLTDLEAAGSSRDGLAQDIRPEGPLGSGTDRGLDREGRLYSEDLLSELFGGEGEGLKLGKELAADPLGCH